MGTGLAFVRSRAEAFVPILPEFFMAKAKKKSKTKVKAKKKAPARAAKAKRPAAKKAKKVKAKRTSKAPARKAAKKTASRPVKKAKKKIAKKQILGEGDYAATRAFDRDQAAFVKKNKSKIADLGKQAEAALDGPEGDALRDAEAKAAGRSRDTF
jgi:hypothetical protein